ncbi:MULTISPECIES: T9SS type A sorting domain-containing protein [unclassified Imperialibacter]|uniref:T9SS type A sorting domain-containing protein n=1 Tax=unclassified Imperialibacter TaxID=2629706 RepID=UPI001869966E|nr:MULTISPECIES: T9SS type A sorting domain-containing protein [unclassified Imperialibacter]
MKNTLKIVLVLVIAALNNQFAVGQKVTRAQTKTNGFYLWSTNANWTDNVAVPVSNIGDTYNSGGNEQIRIEKYITRNGSLSFRNIGANTKEIVIKDTLVVYGNLTFAANSYSLKLLSGAVLIVFGDFSAANKVTLDNGGLLIIDGNMSLTGGNQEYTDNNGGVGNLVVTGTISGNGDTAAASADNSSLSSKSQSIQDFVNGGGSTPLPIVLSYFKGVSLKNAVKLSWETVSEENFDHFEIQRSFDGKDFDVIATEKGNGFTSEKHQYSFTDTNPERGINYYRLNAIDFDGSSEIFETIAVEVVPDFSSVAMYPNPNNGTALQLNIPEELLYTAYSVTMTVSDLQGRVVTTSEITSAHVSTTFDQTLSTGIYLVTIQAGKYSSTYRLMVNQG